MGKILPYNQQIRPEQPNIPAVPDSLARYASGLSLIGEGLTHVSQTLSNIQQEFVQAQDAANYLKLQIAYTKKTGELAAELENNDNPAKMSEEYEKRSSALINELLEPYAASGKMSARGRDYARNRLLLDAQDNKIRMTTIARRRIVDDAVIGLDQYYWQELANRLKSGDSNVDVFISDFAKKVNAITIGQNSDADLGGNIPANILTPKQAYEIIEKYKEHATRVLTKAQEVSAKKTFEGHLVSIAATDGWDSAISFLSDQKTVKKFMDDNGLSLSDMTGSLDELKKFVELKRSEDKEALRASREKIGNEIYKAIEANDFIKARDIISTSNLEPTGENSRVHWTNILTAKAKETETPFAKLSDDQKYFEVSNMIADLKIADLKDDMGSRDKVQKKLVECKSSLTEEDYNRLKHVFEQNYEKKWKPEGLGATLLEDLGALKRIGYFIYGADENWEAGKYSELDVKQITKNTRIFDTIQSNFVQWLKDNPDVSDTEIQNKYQSFVQPAQEQFALNKWTTFWNMSSDEQEIRNRRYWQQIVKEHKQNQPIADNKDKELSPIDKLNNVQWPLTTSQRYRILWDKYQKLGMDYKTFITIVDEKSYGAEEAE